MFNRREEAMKTLSGQPLGCRTARALLLGLVLLFPSGQASTQAPPRPKEAEDPFNRINATVLENGKVVEFSSSDLPAAAVSQRAAEAEISLNTGKPDAIGEPTREKIHPLLRNMISARAAAGEKEPVIITFRENIRIPRFPQPEVNEPRTSEANRAARDRASEITREIMARRAPTYNRLTAELRDRHQAEVLQTFWLTNAMLVRMPLNAVARLAQSDDVLFIEPEQTLDAPPQDTNPNNDVDDGRARMNSDPYFFCCGRDGWIGLLDTGVRFTHTLFTLPSHIEFREDCTSGTCGSTPDPADDCWNHGTSTAAIITGNGNLGNAYRGVTAITLDSFKVYPTFKVNPAATLCGGLNQAAALAAFQSAVQVGDRVIVAQMQGIGNDQSSISLAGDAAFDAGAVVIAANGNNGPSFSTVNTPANAHKVIGVGDYDAETLALITTQSRGPAPDGRTKPDILAPTRTETASNGSDTALRVFWDTSGATPYAAGAAALVHNLLRCAPAVASGTPCDSSFSIDPGQVYAYLILSGQQPYPFDNITGAGQLILPAAGQTWWGKVSVGDQATVDIPLSVSGTSPNTLDAALWWPETATQAHNDIDLDLVDPGGAIQDISMSIDSVFERARVAGPVAAGTWKLRLRGYSVPAGPQTVYWAAYVRR
jgi:serine protease AprX